MILIIRDKIAATHPPSNVVHNEERISMFDVIIAGAGPAGLSAALVLGRQRRSVLLCNDGAPRNATVKTMHGFVSRDGFDPAELRCLGREELAAYDSVQFRAVRIAAARRGPSGFVATPAGATEQKARSLLLARGLADGATVTEGLPAHGDEAFRTAGIAMAGKLIGGDLLSVVQER